MDSTPTIDDLKKIFYSNLYQQVLTDYDKEAKHKLDKREVDAASLFNILTRLERNFKFIGLTSDKVFEYLGKTKHQLISYTISCTNFFISQPEDDGEFPEGEEQGEENKSVTLQIFGISRTFLLDKFCELVILETHDKAQLLEYLKVTRMPGAKKYARQITKLYTQLV